MPLLQVNLEPSRGLPSVSISYSLHGATGELIDAEVTTPIEGALSTVTCVKEMTSRTGKSSGRVSLQMDKNSDMDRFFVHTAYKKVISNRHNCKFCTASLVILYTSKF